MAHMVGKSWEEFHEKEVMICCLFTKTGVGVTANGDDY